MADMLVNLYDLPDCDDLVKRLEDEGINIRRAMAPDLYGILEFVGENYGKHWKEGFWALHATMPPCVISSDPLRSPRSAGARA